MNAMLRIRNHMDAGTLFSWRQECYSGCEVVVVGIVDRTGKGRFERVEGRGQTLNMALDDVADQCDALPGAGRVDKQRKELVA